METIKICLVPNYIKQLVIEIYLLWYIYWNEEFKEIIIK